uniref:NADH dehydrogenase I subunit M n=1 Tax=uncultured prokaryote TaxID=198431 RepID=H5SPB2_9ZZZZ|nr:NADH dehydrogenase I subunit M [uncultured prokaryote]
MEIMDLPILSIVIFLPAIGSIPLFFIRKEKVELIRTWSLIVTIITFFLSIFIYFNFDQNSSDFQFEDRIKWVHELGISYHVGIDGISIWLLLLTTFLGPITVLCSWSAITERVRDYMICLLIIETGILGVFSSLDLFLFYVFWESQLIPMYLLIGIWGSENRIYAAVKFVIYTMAGSLMMLVAIMYIYFFHRNQAGFFSMDLLDLYKLNFPYTTQIILFIAFFLAFAFKVPMFPFHTWLPDAHVEAPTAGSVILAGILLKMGTYGFLRFNIPMFAEASVSLAPFMYILAVTGIIYGALVSMVQPDLKKLVAYSSVSHLGFVMLGIFAFTYQGIQGGILQMVNHGLSTGALFLIVGILYERRHTRMIANFGGLSKVIPRLATIFMIVALSSIGLPGLNGFVGEFLIILGTFISSNPYSRIAAVLAASGVIFAAVYMLWMFQRVMFGRITNEENLHIRDLNLREFSYLLPVILFIVWIGVYPSTFLKPMEKSVRGIIITMEKKIEKANSSNYVVDRGISLTGGSE